MIDQSTIPLLSENAHGEEGNSFFHRTIPHTQLQIIMKQTIIRTHRKPRTRHFSFIFIALTGLSLSLFPACQQSQPQTGAHDHTGVGHDDHHEEEVQAVLTANQKALAGIETGYPEERTFFGLVNANGAIEVPPQSKYSVYSPVSGFVSSVGHYVGDGVRKGELLTRISHPDLIKKQGELLEVLAARKKWEKELARQDALDKVGATSGRSREEALAEQEMALARYKGLRSELTLIGIDVEKLESGGDLQTHIDIRSPASGRISQLSINPGLFVHPDDLLIEVVDGSHLHLELGVFGKDIARIRQGQKVTFQIPGQSVTYEGEVQQVSRVVDPQAKTARVHVHFDDSPDLSPGVYVQAQIQIDPTTRLSVPESAVVKTGDHAVVFIQDGDHFSELEIMAGPALNGFIPLLDSVLTPKSKIVTKGAYYVSGSMEGPREHNH